MTMRSKVYPRVCGGTKTLLNDERHSSGLSPRVRGNQIGCNSPWSPIRSIPACAGEPGAGVPTLAGDTVYPRVCGGTLCTSGARLPLKVYPRVCGGTGSVMA